MDSWIGLEFWSVALSVLSAPHPPETAAFLLEGPETTAVKQARRVLLPMITAAATRTPHPALIKQPFCLRAACGRVENPPLDVQDESEHQHEPATAAPCLPQAGVPLLGLGPAQIRSR